MAFNKLGLVTIHHLGSISGAAGETRAFHTYLTNDDDAAVETSGYFNDMAYKFKTGDILMASLDLDGTPALRSYVIVNTAGVITVTLSTATAAA